MPRYVTEEIININKIPSLTTAVRHFVLFAKRLGGYQAQCPRSQKYLGRGPEGRILRKKTFIKLERNIPMITEIYFY